MTKLLWFPCLAMAFIITALLAREFRKEHCEHWGYMCGFDKCFNICQDNLWQMGVYPPKPVQQSYDQEPPHGESLEQRRKRWVKSSRTDADNQELPGLKVTDYPEKPNWQIKKVKTIPIHQPSAQPAPVTPPPPMWVDPNRVITAGAQ